MYKTVREKELLKYSGGIFNKSSIILGWYNEGQGCVKDSNQEKCTCHQ